MVRHLWQSVAVAGLILITGGSLFAADAKLTVSVEAGDFDRVNTPVTVCVAVPEENAEVKTVTLSDPKGNKIVAQLTAPDLLAPAYDAGPGKVLRQLNFILPELAKGQTLKLSGDLNARQPTSKASLTWKHQKDKYSELSAGDRPVMRYMCQPVDKTSKESRFATGKVFHHLYDPAGKRFVTNGPGGLFPHHRGLFFGYTNCSYEGCPKANTWYCHDGELQTHEGTVSEESGPVLGRHQVKVDWRNQKGEVFAKENREMTVYNVPGGTMVEFATNLKSTVGKVKLDGDAQHAGFQFRASNDVAEKTSKQTYYLRPDGKDKPGSFRNPDRKNREATPKCKDLPWNAVSFVLDNKRYTVVYIDSPQNPRPSWHSERDYARFGCYFPYEIDKGKDLTATYRVWLQEGEMNVAEAAALANDMAHPPITVATVTTGREKPAALTPPEGFTMMFNGKDFTGLRALGHFDPAKYRAMSDEDRKKLDAKMMDDFKNHWRVENGELVNDGHGPYATSEKDYGDFELWLEYKTVPLADSGIYLRGIPQVQIWDTRKEGGKWNIGADKGSGALWNNPGEGKWPKVHADRPFGEWNSVKVKMIGDKVTVVYNDKLVVENAPLSNYYNREAPAYDKGPIQLQTHGGEIRWRNVFIREIPRK
ncbi:MAG: PmoA family protein [Pirellulales bacterium]|nr:PmoA family protein [Pirellulales bacterium]